MIAWGASALVAAAALLAACGSSGPADSGSGDALLRDSADQCCVEKVGASSYCQCTSSGAPPCVCHGDPQLECSPAAGTCGGDPPVGPTATPAPPGPTPTPGPAPSGQAGAKILIELETPAFNLPDFHGLPDNLGAHFATGAIIHPYNGVATAPTIAAWSDGCDRLANVGVHQCEHWIGLYLGYDAGGHLTDCNESKSNPTTGKKEPNPDASAANCQAGVQQVYDEFTAAGAEVHGLFVDNEGTSPTIFVPALAAFRDATPGLQLGSTKTIQDMRNPTPSGVGGKPWDHSLGQFYTIGYPTNLYEGSCDLKPGFWDYVKTQYGTNLDTPPGAVFWAGYRVPMLCGAGDCQDCISEAGCETGQQCMDNRLEPAELEAWIDARPSGFPLHHMAIWYGVRPAAGAECCYSAAAGTDTCVPGPWTAGTCPTAAPEP